MMLRLTLQDPLIITSRLMAGVKVGDATISIEYGDWTRDGRISYHWYIDLGEQEFEGNDLCSGVGGGTLQQGLESLLAFLGAFGEGYRHEMHTGCESEHKDLFPEGLAEWAYLNIDELGMLQMELEENEGLIEEH